MINNKKRVCPDCGPEISRRGFVRTAAGAAAAASLGGGMIDFDEAHLGEFIMQAHGQGIESSPDNDHLAHPTAAQGDACRVFEIAFAEGVVELNAGHREPLHHGDNRAAETAHRGEQPVDASGVFPDKPTAHLHRACGQQVPDPCIAAQIEGA